MARRTCSPTCPVGDPWHGSWRPRPAGSRRLRTVDRHTSTPATPPPPPAPPSRALALEVQHAGRPPSETIRISSRVCAHAGKDDPVARHARRPFAAPGIPRADRRHPSPPLAPESSVQDRHVGQGFQPRNTPDAAPGASASSKEPVMPQQRRKWNRHRQGCPLAPANHPRSGSTSRPSSLNRCDRENDSIPRPLSRTRRLLPRPAAPDKRKSLGCRN